MELVIARRKPTERAHGLRTLNSRIEVLREFRDNMPIQMVSVFLAVAMKPGVHQCDLTEITGLSQSSVSRNIHALGKFDRHGKPGLDLIEQRCSIAGSKSHELRLTKTGKELAKRLILPR